MITRHKPSRWWQTLLGLTLLTTLALAGLTTAKPLTDAPEPQAESQAESVANAVADEKPPALDAETEKLLALAESMVTLPDITAERLRDVAEDLASKKFYQDVVTMEPIGRTLVKVYDKIIALKPEAETLGNAYVSKRYVLSGLIGVRYADEDIAALEQFADETDNAGNHRVDWARSDAKSWVKQMKIWQIYHRPEYANRFQSVRSEICDSISSPDFVRTAFIAESLVDMTSILKDRNIITREQLLETFVMAIDAMKKSPDANDEYMLRVRNGIEFKLGFLQAEGNSLEITGTDMNGQPFDWAACRGKPVLMAFTSSWYGGREMQNMLELTEEFAGQGVQWGTYVSLNGKGSEHDTAQENKWLELCVERLDYPGVVLTEIDTLDGAVRGIVDHLGRQSYSSAIPRFMIVDKDGKIVSLGDAAKVRGKLSELFGTPNEAAVARGRERSRDFTHIPKPCISNFMKLALAIHYYYDAHKTLPPAYTIDNKGNKLHSWRVLLLPYLDQQALYEQIRLDEPWNSEYNKKFNGVIVPVFQCHENPFADNPKPITTYAAIVGKECVFEENGKQNGFIDIEDGLSNTVLFVERATPVNWMDPTDITFDEAVKGIGVSTSGIAGPHNGGSNCAFCDGSTRFLPGDIDLKLLRAIITRSGGEAVSFPE